MIKEAKDAAERARNKALKKKRQGAPSFLTRLSNKEHKHDHNHKHGPGDGHEGHNYKPE